MIDYIGPEDDDNVTEEPSDDELLEIENTMDDTLSVEDLLDDSINNIKIKTHLPVSIIKEIKKIKRKQ